jgi:hypothetical protein
MDECKNNFSSTWSFVQLLCFLIKLFPFTILIFVSLLISLSTNFKTSRWRYGESLIMKVSSVILKVLGISLLWFTRLLVDVCNVQNEQKKLFTIMYKSITNEEKEGELKHDVQIFNEQVV